MNKIRIVKIMLRIFCIIIFMTGFYFTYILFTGGFDPFSTLIAVIVQQILVYQIFIFLATTILFLKLINKERRCKIYYTVAITGFSLAIIMSLPLIVTPISISNAESEFIVAYGENWEDQIPEEVKNNYFLTYPFAFGATFLGWPLAECLAEKDIEYYNDGEIRLLFDVYMPKEYNPNLPGNRSIIIMIHGGGWATGDRGQGLPIIKYLAAQGYIIFDIQYGLIDLPELREYFALAGYDEQNIGKNVTVKDQVRHIGNFTKKLASEYASIYNANLKSVFIMGGSAGGHLTGVIGFGYNEGGGIYAEYYNNTFAHNLTVRAIIPLYPANSMREVAEGLGEKLLGVPYNSSSNIFEAFTPSELVDPNDPPALIFQGMADVLVRPYMSAEIETAMDNAGVTCCRIEFPFAGHANEMLLNNPHGQVWLYYLERFLYLNK
ncbi:MAG: alpha/beta hydrolase [Candidatus Hermodarchaeota archaeon]